MSPALIRLLESTSRIALGTDQRIDAALNSYKPPSAIIRDRTAFVQVIAELHHAVACHLYHTQKDWPIDVEFEYGITLLFLKQEYGRNGDLAALEIARSGEEGGIRSVLRTVAQAMGKKHAEELISLCVDSYWTGQKAHELIEDARSYVRQFASLIPAGMLESGGVRIMAEFRQVLKKHPFMIAELRRKTRI